MLVNDVSLRGLAPGELAKGFGFFQSKPSSAFSPVAVTPDELGDAWDGGRLHLPLNVDFNGKPFGRANAGVDMTFDFPQLIAHAARTRPLAAGSIIGSGTVSNKLDGGPGKPVAEGGAGYSCIVEMRTVETLAARRGEDAVPVVRRHGPHRDEGPRRPLDLRRDRAERATRPERSSVMDRGMLVYSLFGLWALAMVVILITAIRLCYRVEERSRSAAQPDRCARQRQYPRGDVQLESRAGRRDASLAAPHELPLADGRRRLRAWLAGAVGVWRRGRLRWICSTTSGAWPQTTAGPTTASIAPCWRFEPGEFEAARIGFFPSIKATLNHILAVDLLYLDMLEEGGVGAGIFDDFVPFHDAGALAEAQATFDLRLIEFCGRLAASDLDRRVDHRPARGRARSPSASATCWRICSSTRSTIADRCMPCCRARR